MLHQKDTFLYYPRLSYDIIYWRDKRKKKVDQSVKQNQACFIEDIKGSVINNK